MFDFFKRRNQPEFKDTDLDRFKELTRDPRVLEALYKFDLGFRNLPLDIATEVQECIQLSYSITSRAQIISTQLFDAAKSGHWQPIHVRLSQLSQHKNTVSKIADQQLEAIIDWANQFNIPELSNIDTMFYKTTGIPRNKKDLMALRFIHVPNAGITEIPPELSILQNVQGICLSGNLIKVIPYQICEMISVTMLDLDDNLIMEIPEDIGNMIRLCQIDLDENNIKTIPNSLLKLENLTTLRLKKQKHGYSLNEIDAPLSEASQRVLARLFDKEDFRLTL